MEPGLGWRWAKQLWAEELWQGAEDGTRQLRSSLMQECSSWVLTLTLRFAVWLLVSVSEPGLFLWKAGTFMAVLWGS